MAEKKAVASAFRVIGGRVGVRSAGEMLGLLDASGVPEHGARR
jgi:hypothetical protein